MLRLNKKSLVAGIAIGVVGALLAMPAIQLASADEMNVKPYKDGVEKVAVVDSSGKQVSNKELQEIEAQEQALDAKEDQLEKDYEAGKISREEYIKQEAALDAQDDQLDAREDKAEKAAGIVDDDDDDDQVVKKSNKSSNSNNNNSQIANAKKKLAEIQKQERALDAKEDKLENDYESGKISRDEFLKQEAALEAEEDRLDALEDKYEKILGYDVDDDDDDEYDD